MATSDLLGAAGSGAAAGSAIMPGWGTAVGAAVGIAANLLGSAAQKKKQQALDKEQAELTGEKQENKNIFNKDYYSNALDRTENSAALTRANDFYKQRAAIDKKTSAVTGATAEATNANKAQYSNAYSNLIGNIAATGSEAKDRALALYRGQQGALRGQQNYITSGQNAIQDEKIQSAANLQSNAAGLVKSGLTSLATPNLNSTSATPTTNPKSALNSFNLSTYTDPATGMKLKI